MHVGTHMDSPLHMISGGKSIDEIPIESFMGNGVLINAYEIKEIGLDILKDIEINSNDIVLIHTGFDKFYNESKYFDKSPFITNEFAEFLVTKKIKMLGLDFSGPDIDTSWPVHKILLYKGIPIKKI